MIFDNLSPLTPEEVTQGFQSGNIAIICETLVAEALYDADWKKVQGYCLEFLEHPDAGVRMVAATCIGHLARIHQQLDLDLVLPALYRHQSDTGPYVAGNVDNALSSIERFMHVPVKRDPAMRDPDVEDVEFEEDDEEEEPPLTDEEVAHAFQSGDILEIERTLVALALRHPDWRKTEAYCLEFLEHSNSSVRGVAADCISHLIYNQHHLDVDLARSALSRHLSDPSKEVVKNVKYALNAIELFVKASAERAVLREKEAEPTNGQRALNNSVSITSNTSRRIGVDMYTGEIVILDDMGRTYRGHIRNWAQLSPLMKIALSDNGFIEKRGRIIVRDGRGNIIGYGKNVIKGK